MKIPFLQQLFAAGSNKISEENNATAFTKIDLGEDIRFMYENFIVSTQHTLYLVLEHRGEDIICLKFDFLQFQYGYPNDEAPHRYDVSGYGLFEVHHSPLIASLERQNRTHSRHDRSHYNNYRHFVVRFKDVSLDVVGKAYSIEILSSAEFDALLKRELEFVSKEN